MFLRVRCHSPSNHVSSAFICVALSTSVNYFVYLQLCFSLFVCDIPYSIDNLWTCIPFTGVTLIYTQPITRVTCLRLLVELLVLFGIKRTGRSSIEACRLRATPRDLERLSMALDGGLGGSIHPNRSLTGMDSGRPQATIIYPQRLLVIRVYAYYLSIRSIPLDFPGLVVIRMDCSKKYNDLYLPVSTRVDSVSY